MTYFRDLSPYAFIPAPRPWGSPPPAMPELNVGWLDARHEFPLGATAPELVEKLDRLCRASRYHLTRGWHSCPFCDGVHARGSAEIRVAGNGVVYAAPALIAHYVAVHRYVPPPGFVDALRTCDDVADVVPSQPENESR